MPWATQSLIWIMYHCCNFCCIYCDWINYSQYMNFKTMLWINKLQFVPWEMNLNFSVSLKIFGLALIVPGVMILANNDVVNSKVLPLMKQLTFGGINMGDMIIGLCVSLIVVGTLVILVSLLGLIGACSGNPAYLDIVSKIWFSHYNYNELNDETFETLMIIKQSCISWTW